MFRIILFIILQLIRTELCLHRALLLYLISHQAAFLAAAAASQWQTVLEYIGILGTLFLTWRYFAFGTSTEMKKDFEKVQGAAGAVAGVASGVLGAVGEVASAAQETRGPEVAEAPEPSVQAVEAEPQEEAGEVEVVSEPAAEAEVELVEEKEPSED